MEGSATLLLVDDDDFARECLRDALAGERYQLREAADGEEAISLLGHAVPDLVLLDLLMPRMSGLEVLERLRARWPRLPVLVISSLDTKSLVDQALGAGAAGFISKPFHPLEVRDEVSRVLSG
jgi:two-component system, chemotaxis family, chemotaxis protein CheY